MKSGRITDVKESAECRTPCYNVFLEDGLTHQVILCAIVSKHQYQSGASRFTYRFYNLRLDRLYVERYGKSPDTAIVEP